MFQQWLGLIRYFGKPFYAVKIRKTKKIEKSSLVHSFFFVLKNTKHTKFREQ